MTTLDCRCTRERKIADLSSLGLPGARILGRYAYLRPHPALPSHRHPGMLEICYLHRGRQHYEVEGRQFQLSGGDMFVTLPGERHSTGPEPEDRGVLYWLILRVQPPPRHFLGHVGSSGKMLAQALRDIPRRCFRAPARTREVLERLLRLPERAAADPFSPLTARCQLTEFLIATLAAAHKGSRFESERWLHAVCEHMERHLHENLQVPDMAAISGLSVSRFKMRFRELAGMAPAEYFLARRIEMAGKRLTGTALSVTEIAYDMGFSSGQSFATAFRRLTGKTPTEYRLLRSSAKSGAERSMMEK